MGKFAKTACAALLVVGGVVGSGVPAVADRPHHGGGPGEQGQHGGHGRDGTQLGDTLWCC